MSKIESRLKELESKIEGISQQLGKLNELLIALHNTDRSLSSIYAEWIERKRKEAEKTEEKFQIRVYYQGLLMGLVLGNCRKHVYFIFNENVGNFQYIT